MLIHPHKHEFRLRDAMANRQAAVEQCVEDLCNQGCREVTRYIKALQAGKVFPEVAMLDAAGRREVLQELVDIMAAYGGSCEG